jgi:uncharacterized lipoprotein YmbA
MRCRDHAGACRSPASSFYRLKPDATLTTMDTAVPLYVVVNPVTIPALVDRPQIVVSLPGNQVWPDEFQRWAEPLKGNIQRTTLRSGTQARGIVEEQRSAS